MTMNDTNKPAPKAGSDNTGGETLSPQQLDVQVPQTDDDLNAALEDTFPASDPINFAGSITGIPAEEPAATSGTERPTEEPASPPIGTHPMNGAEDDDEAEKALS